MISKKPASCHTVACGPNDVPEAIEKQIKVFPSRKRLGHIFGELPEFDSANRPTGLRRWEVVA
jgi:hypothetical protein